MKANFKKRTNELHDLRLKGSAFIMQGSSNHSFGGNSRIVTGDLLDRPLSSIQYFDFWLTRQFHVRDHKSMLGKSLHFQLFLERSFCNFKLWLFCQKASLIPMVY